MPQVLPYIRRFCHLVRGPRAVRTASFFPSVTTSLRFAVDRAQAMS